MKTPRFTVIVGRAHAPDAEARRQPAGPAGDAAGTGTSAAWWPFLRHVTPDGSPPLPSSLVLRDLHRAFPGGQTAGTRLVLTQATYQLQRWLDWLDRHPALSVVADLSAASPAQARDAVSRRGPWARITVETVPPREADDDDAGSGAGAGDNPLAPVRAAFEQADPEERWRQARRLAYDFPSHAALHLAFASASMELGRLDDAHAALDRAGGLAPEWEAVHFELGKLWLRTDDTERAAASFAEAGRLMPTFSAAFSNLGAALGELDRPEEALAALQQALRFDPYGHPILNNIGATARDLGRLDEAEAAFRLAVTHAPHFVFAHYNLGHTFFLQGRFAEARDAYARGLELDPQKSPWQRCRAALALAATNDAAAAATYFEDALADVAPEQREALVGECAAVLRAIGQLPGVAPDGISRLLTLLERG